MASKSYPFVWVTRDLDGDFVEVWDDPADPRIDDDGHGVWYCRGTCRLTVVCIDEFVRVFHWTPKPGKRYKVEWYTEYEEA